MSAREVISTRTTRASAIEANKATRAKKTRRARKQIIDGSRVDLSRQLPNYEITQLPNSLSRFCGYESGSCVDFGFELFVEAGLIIVTHGGEDGLTLFNLLPRRSFGQGQKREKLLLHVYLGIELVKPQELALLVDLQEPPFALIVDGKIRRAEGDSSRFGKGQHGLLNLRRSVNDLHLNQSLAGILPPIERAFGIVESIGIDGGAQNNHSYVKFLDYHLLVNGGGIGEHFVGRQVIHFDFEGLSDGHTAAVFFPDVWKESLADGPVAAFLKEPPHLGGRVRHESFRHVHSAFSCQQKLYRLVVDEAGGGVLVHHPDRQGLDQVNQRIVKPAVFAFGKRLV